MADSTELEKDAAVFAQRAVKCDQELLMDTAIFYYVEAGQALLSALQAGSHIPNLMEKANEYLDRAEVLKGESLLLKCHMTCLINICSGQSFATFCLGISNLNSALSKIILLMRVWKTDIIPIPKF